MFVQPDPRKNEYAMRRVAVVRRLGNVAHVRSKVGARNLPPRAEDGEPELPLEPLKPGELVVTSSVIELTQKANDLLDAAQSEK